MVNRLLHLDSLEEESNLFDMFKLAEDCPQRLCFTDESTPRWENVT